MIAPILHPSGARGRSARATTANARGPDQIRENASDQPEDQRRHGSSRADKGAGAVSLAKLDAMVYAFGPTSMKVDLPPSWSDVVGRETTKPYFKDLCTFVDEERKAHVVFPPEDDVWTAFHLTPFESVRVVILGQDPYIGEGQAHGLCFSVRLGVKPPPSLANLFREAKTDIEGFEVPDHGFLEPWAKQGVFLLNTILTVRQGEAGSHRGKGWETFTDVVIAALSARKDPLVFALLGGFAQKKEKLIDAQRHRIVKAAHPSPLSAKAFFGSKPFSGINGALKGLGKAEIDWRLPKLASFPAGVFA